MIALRHLSRSDVLSAGGGDFRLALDDVCDATRLLQFGEAAMVAETVMPLGADPRDNAYGLPARLGGRFDAVGLKWAMHRSAPIADLPSVVSTTLVSRLSDGRPIGLVESALLTRMRTAAVTAIAMAMLPTDAIRSVAVLGAGEQARAHVSMLRALHPSLARISVWNRTAARRDALVRDFAASEGKPIPAAADTIAGALEGAEVVLCCTNAPEPLLGAEAVAPGRLIVQIGYHEVAFAAIEASDRVVVDLWGDFAETSAKSLFRMYRAGRFAPGRVDADLAGLVVDGWRPEPGASVYFSSFGLNLFDIALASRVLAAAERHGLGAVLPLL
ncbi:ornithine cyclodeaminase family protein [Jiella sonneratiae]|uniref:Ornithine cyclodeaminase family protein n=1 Tax=Jiella sonneratiae TaxID=2816856 RepID=A0ABS3J688_9HYPH|nr:ornithine cyclodeaminase family protein [Jiella sonneratiae]MBO0905193.1 ornithine cyclodeaminase family protein [Jiella sonneratiae]